MENGKLVKNAPNIPLTT